MRAFTPTLAVLTLSASALTAIAGTPAALDRVPADADVVVGVSNLADFLTDMDQFNQLMGPNAQPEFMFVTAMVRGMPGVNLDGSAAIILDLPADPAAGGEPVVVALIPVSDFAAFSQNRAADNGLVTLAFPDAEVFARDLGGGMAVISDNADAARAYDATKGKAKAHADRLGGAGNRLVDSSEVSILLNADSLRPYLDQAVVGMKQQGEMVAMMGGEQAAVGFNSFLTIATTAINDLAASAMGFSFNEAGMNYDLALQFKPESKSSSYFAKGGKTTGLLNHLPAGPYMFAAALDTSSPAVAKLAEAVAAWKATLPAEMQNQMGMTMGQMSLKDLNQLASGVSFVMGSTPGLMGGGLFANTTQFIQTKEPGTYRQAMLSTLNATNGQSTNGVTINTTVSPDAVTIDGVNLTSYAATIKVDPEAAAAMGGAMPGMDPTMIMQMVFGPTGGPAGYLAEVKGGVVQTMSQGPELTRRALTAAKSGEGLGADDRVKRIAGSLQDGRVAEIFIGVDEILNMVGPMAMMFGAIPEFQPVQAMDPIALGLTSDAGGFTGRVHIPSATFKAITALAPAQGMDAGEEQGEEGFDF
jgi:hypothetical protein